MVHPHILREEPVVAVREAVAAAAVVAAEDALGVHKAAVVLADPCMRLRAARDAEGSDAAAAADAFAAVALREAAAAAVVAAADAASAEWPQPNLSSRCCLECPLGHFHLWVLSVHWAHRQKPAWKQGGQTPLVRQHLRPSVGHFPRCPPAPSCWSQSDGARICPAGGLQRS